MNNKERILADTLGDGDGAIFARAAAAYARRRRTIRQAGLAGVACALVIAFFSLRAPPTAQKTVPVSPVKIPAFEIISDQELVAQLKDRPALFLKDRTGITGVVFLADNKAAVKL
ncbi:MAG: hypothetical protein KA257_08735 [Opitutaceae bacterium]|nr:hypothetical protein [Opitutaceae bacterium]MBP9912033.1 hypothetical protein [Opitutaceae bacterium]